jgi:hypothetical protein
MRGQKQKAEELFRKAAAKPNGEQDGFAILCMLRHRQKEWGRAQVLSSNLPSMHDLIQTSASSSLWCT